MYRELYKNIDMGFSMVCGRYYEKFVSLFLKVGAVFLLSVLGQVSYAQPLLNEPVKPLPIKQLNADKVKLGERLFHDKRFSKDNSLSCASCHLLEHGGADTKVHSVGIGGMEGEVNSPSVLNASHNFRQFWDGRAATLEDQIGFVVENPAELDSNWKTVLDKLNADAALVGDFKKIYPEGISTKTITDAIATYERSLAADSRFDLYLRGDATAISAEEKEGYEKFKAYGCIACHQGVNVGGNMYQVFGVMGNYFKDRGNIKKADYGRFNVTGKESDRHMFKVPSLRNVVLTPPYFHDGSARTLEEAVNVMFKYQLGRQASEKDKKLIIKFLGSLTGKKYELNQGGGK